MNPLPLSKSLVHLMAAIRTLAVSQVVNQLTSVLEIICTALPSS